MTRSRLRRKARRRAAPATVTALVAVALIVGIAPARAAFPGANGKIAFETTRDGNLEIYSMAPDGSGQVNLTNDTRADTDAVWSMDGTRIAFVRATAHNDIWVMNADGSGQVNLTPLPNDGQGNAGINPTWSPDDRIAYADSDEIWVMNADGSGKTNLTNTPATVRIEGLPSWSPDGTRIAFIVEFDVWVMNADGSSPTQLTFTSGAGTAERWPNWSPDGTRIVYDRSGQAWVMNADGSGQTPLTGGPGESGEQPAFSPDGTKIVFHSNAFDAPNGDDIFVMNADGTGVTRLPTAVPASDNDPDWQAAALPPPEPEVSIGDATITEGDTGTADAVFEVTLSSPSSQTVTVDFATADGTATAGADYAAASGTVSFAAGETSTTIAVEVLSDTADEPDETFFVDLSNAVGATISDGRGTGTILDDDPTTSHTLTVTVRGNGVVTSSPEGINCRAKTSSDCSQSYPDATVVTLTARAGQGWVFARWSGDCTVVKGTRCRVEMTADRSVTATFTRSP